MGSDDDNEALSNEEVEGEDEPEQQACTSLPDGNATVGPTSTMGLPDANKSKKKTKKLPPIRVNLSACKYEVLRIVARKLGWREVGDDEDWELYWTDTSVSIERVIKLSKTQKVNHFNAAAILQKINHFNGMLEICRKKSMARNLAKMAKLFPGHYDFFPRTFLLPNDIQELLADVKARGKKQVYIFKPDAGCQGRGIRLLQGGKEEAAMKLVRDMEALQQVNVVAQHYLAKPLLVNGYKFDMRIYALVLCCDPLRVFLFHEGLARFCTEKYCKPKADNLNVAFMHLTNYAVNKHNEHFVANQLEGDNSEDASKWTLQQLAEHLNGQGHDWAAVWARIQQLVVKSLISVQPILRNNYRSVLPPDNDGYSCFEILGYDIMLDSTLQPWLIEVNHSPSFNIDSPLDLAIKEQLITETIELVRVDPKLIAKAKKADRKAAAGRLLEPLQKKKPPQQAPAGPPASAAAVTVANSSSASGIMEKSSSTSASLASLPGTSTLHNSNSGVGSASTAAVAPASSTVSGQAPSCVALSVEDPGGGAKTARSLEGYEAIRLETLRQREKYEARHSGGFTRIYPTTDCTLQGLYEELLRGATELFQSTFQAKAKKALDALEEKRKQSCKDEEDANSRAQRERAKAHRDRLAQLAAERRTRKAAESAQLMMAGQPNAVTQGSVMNASAITPHGLISVGQSGGPGLYSFPSVASAGPRMVSREATGLTEVWGESDGSPAGSLPSSRPISARSSGLGVRIAGSARQHNHALILQPTAPMSAHGHMPTSSNSWTTSGTGVMLSQYGGISTSIQQGALPPHSFRISSIRRCDSGGSQNKPAGAASTGHAAAASMPQPCAAAAAPAGAACMLTSGTCPSKARPSAGIMDNAAAVGHTIPTLTSHLDCINSNSGSKHTVSSTATSLVVSSPATAPATQGQPSTGAQSAQAGRNIQASVSSVSFKEVASELETLGWSAHVSGALPRAGSSRPASTTAVPGSQQDLMGAAVANRPGSATSISGTLWDRPMSANMASTSVRASYSGPMSTLRCPSPAVPHMNTTGSNSNGLPLWRSMSQDRAANTTLASSGPAATAMVSKLQPHLVAGASSLGTSVTFNSRSLLTGNKVSSQPSVSQLRYEAALTSSGTYPLQPQQTQPQPATSAAPTSCPEDMVVGGKDRLSQQPLQCQAKVGCQGLAHGTIKAARPAPVAAVGAMSHGRARVSNGAVGTAPHSFGGTLQLAHSDGQGLMAQGHVSSPKQTFTVRPVMVGTKIALARPAVASRPVPKAEIGTVGMKPGLSVAGQGVSMHLLPQDVK